MKAAVRRRHSRAKLMAMPDDERPDSDKNINLWVSDIFKAEDKDKDGFISFKEFGGPKGSFQGSDGENGAAAEVADQTGKAREGSEHSEL